MAPTQTTTLRMPLELRDEIARLAQERGSTMLDVVADAIHRLARDEWWGSVRQALDDLPDVEVAEYADEAEQLDRATGDGLRDS